MTGGRTVRGGTVVDDEEERDGASSPNALADLPFHDPAKDRQRQTQIAWAGVTLAATIVIVGILALIAQPSDSPQASPPPPTSTVPAGGGSTLAGHHATPPTTTTTIASTTTTTVPATPASLAIEPAVVFGPNQATLTPAADPTLNQVAADLRRLPPSAVLVVTGWAHDSGDPATDVALSEARAEAVAAGLRDRGIDPARIRTFGRGEGTTPAESPGGKVDFWVGELPA